MRKIRVEHISSLRDLELEGLEEENLTDNDIVEICNMYNPSKNKTKNNNRK
jgi:hypothetical protein